MLLKQKKNIKHYHLINGFKQSIDNIDWENRKYVLTKSQGIETLDRHYKHLGLGDPQMSKRVSPNKYWSAVFSKVWKLFWESVNLVEFISLKHVFNYLSVVNMIFAAKFDVPFRAVVEKHRYNSKILTYEQWSIYKKEHKKEFTVELGQNVEQFVNAVIKPHISLETANWQGSKEGSSTWSKQIIKID